MNSYCDEFIKGNLAAIKAIKGVCEDVKKLHQSLISVSELERMLTSMELFLKDKKWQKEKAKEQQINDK